MYLETTLEVFLCVSVICAISGYTEIAPEIAEYQANHRLVKNTNPSQQSSVKGATVLVSDPALTGVQLPGAIT